ncbi:helix-turn-helix transcriptional regulator [Mucilaginibacter gossypii]|uniref:helix-turn-helix domain-containing protein n=1 Tax=Mucilaginibacter gossypii TaxID=551996 RepID=UPI000DCD7429|nr:MULTISPECIES: helix-turn-helix transcriptional regulator [Mucilaginibacter]QTE35871.1 helix-turn-helix transcriptional regulator [Mucilaginibacter gossypii]RAV54677.1 transcriptional regulator [Mucilaginibacter rubeus]
MYGAKIRMIRELRGYSQENVAAKLGMTQASYSRIENNQTKLDTSLLEKLAKELGVSASDIMSAEPVVVNFYGPNHGAAPFGSIGTINIEQKELYEKLLTSKDEEIAHLKLIIESLLPKR